MLNKLQLHTLLAIGTLGMSVGNLNAVMLFKSSCFKITISNVNFGKMNMK